MPASRKTKRNPPAEPSKAKGKQERNPKEEKPKKEAMARNTVAWTHELEERMLTIIVEDKRVHQGLFPGPGTTRDDGTGSNKLPKSDFEWIVAERLFAQDEAYMNVFAESAKTSRGRLQWTTKVKNKLKQMRQTVGECSEMMGETGQGCMSEEDVKAKNIPHLTRTWAQVKEKCPWYFTLKRLISERPNLVPVGLGNNTSGYDTSILMDEEDDSKSAVAKAVDNDETKPAADDEEMKDEPLSDDKATVKGKEVTIKKEGVTPAKRMKSQIDRIAETEMAKLDVKRVKAEVEKERLKAITSMASAKAEAKLQKQRLDHEYRMETLRHRQIVAPPSQGGLQPYSAVWPSPTPLSGPGPFTGSGIQPFSEPASPQSRPSVGFEPPQLEGFPLPTAGPSGGEVPGSDLFNETTS